MFLLKTTRCRAWVGSASSSASASTRRSMMTTFPNSKSGACYPPFHNRHILPSSNSHALLHMSSSPSSSLEDRSAASKSRAPFRSPKSSPDDSKSPIKIVNNKQQKTLTWNPLGLLTELVDCLEKELRLEAPTPVQSLVIPEILKEDKESLAFLAATGSGKTLAYLLPLLQQLKQQEVFENYERRPRRPRLLILAPTRELAMQISQVMKSLSHSIKLSSQAVVGGQKDRGIQRKALERPVDVIVATPGRLLQHWKNGNVFLGSVETVVVDEMDTMMEQGFQRELRELLYPLLYQQQKAKADATTEGDEEKKMPPKKKQQTDNDVLLPLKEKAPRLILTSATMTQSIQKLLGDNPKTSKLAVTARKLHRAVEAPTDTAAAPATAKLQFPPMRIISAPGLHKAIPRLEQVFVDVGQTDKISLLLDVISSSQDRFDKTIIFCNTAASVRAVQYALGEARLDTLAYHGELNSVTRSENLKKFRSDCKYLVCTDLAARGLDIPQVQHVVMFDFPLNAMDYLHRSGRTARGDGNGKVTALVAKRDKVLATAIEQAVVRGDALDGLSSRKSDYLPGARLGVQPKRDSNTRGGGGGGRGGGGGGRRGRSFSESKGGRSGGKRSTTRRS